MINRFITLVLLSVSLCCGIGSAESQVPPAPTKTQIVIIGTIHDKHYENPTYSPDVLKEIILSLKPDAILNELPLSLVDPNGRPLENLRKKNLPGGPECWAADTVAIQLGIKQIPFDRPDRQENFKKTKYFEKEKQSNESTQKWAEQTHKEDPNSIDLKILLLDEYAGKAQAKMWEMNFGPEVFNSELFDLIIRIKHSVGNDIAETIFKKYPGYESLADDCKFFRDQWLERNKIMAENIKKTAREYPGKRLVVITGGEHRYILRDLLKDVNSIDLKEYWEITPPEVNKPHEINELNQPAYLKPIPPEKLKEDLDFLFKTIEEVHPNMYAYTSREKFKPSRDKLYNQITQPMSRLEFYKAVAPVVAGLKNGHTYIDPPKEEFTYYLENGGKLFPVEFLCTGNPVTLAACYGVDDLPIGGEVLQIDNRDAKEFLINVARYWPAENRAYNLGMLERGLLFASLWLEKGNEQTLRLKIKNRNGIINEYVIEAIGYEEIKQSVLKKQKQQDHNKVPDADKDYSYRLIEDSNVGLIKFNAFTDLQKFKEFLSKTFAMLKEQNISNLIIDIRDNPGGDSILGDELIGYLTDKPFVQFEKIEEKISKQACEKKKWLKEQYPSIKIGEIKSSNIDLIEPKENLLRFRGKTFLLIDPKTASSGVSFAAAIKYFGIGILVGQETLDTPVNYGECMMQKLPNSELDFSVACKRFVCAGGKEDGRGVLPDYEVKQKPQDTAKGVDTVLQFTLNLIKEGGQSAQPKQEI